MRYLLLFLLLALQSSVFGYSANSQYKSDAQKVLITVKSDLNARSNIDFAYQGQYEDSETGLCYNRFRYFSSESGTYISQDPIGLTGKMPNMYSYVDNSNSWVDIFGLNPLVVIGEGMGRVKDMATSLDAHEIGSVWDSSKPAMKQNWEWIQNLIGDKAIFVDIGTDGHPKPSSFYEMEIRELKKAGYVPLDVSKVKGMHGNKIKVPKGTKMWVSGCK